MATGLTTVNHPTVVCIDLPHVLACYSGKTTLLSVLAHGEPVETVPTIGLNVKVFKKGQVNMKCWDIGTFIHLFGRNVGKLST